MLAVKKTTDQCATFWSSATVQFLWHYSCCRFARHEWQQGRVRTRQVTSSPIITGISNIKPMKANGRIYSGGVVQCWY